ncbi:MAG: universal stress protein [Thermoleophilia bacterium]
MIVLGYDGSEPARRALDAAAERARDGHQKLLVLAVLEMPLDPNAPRAYGTAGDGEPLRGPFPEPPEIEEILTDARGRLEGAGVRADYAWAAGEPATVIVEAAQARRASAIVVGHHHHTMLGRLFGTDVAADVQRRAGCDVMVVD